MQNIFAWLQLVTASISINSAYRAPNESFEHAVHRHQELLRKTSPDVFATEGSAYSSAVPVDKADFSAVPVWEQDIQKNFERVRDERFIAMDGRADFPRRSTWLYPHDGCWARAALAGKRIEEWSLARPAKLFIFGSLTVKTVNAPGGSVSWWYHVVPIVKDAEQNVLVIDPAIDPKAPMPVKDWIATMTPSADAVKIAVCDPLTFGPHSTCQKATKDDEGRALDDQKRYLGAEWQNLIQLKRDPEKELGETPPWALELPSLAEAI
jgi:hypothetical protein